jgi:glycyl-tRNA synthetase
MNEEVKANKIISISRRRGLYWPSFEIYGGLAGFYDYGPLGLLLRENIFQIWRRMYRLEGFYEIDTPNINPEEVFVASGHVSSFSDLLVTCNKCGESFRADHLTAGIVVSTDIEEIKRALASGKVKCTRCGSNSFSEPRQFNLMFRTFIGPYEGKKGYLRPETAQGIFINFQQLLRFFRDSLPFGIIQRGKGFRNEISPRQGFIRLREFNMLEAELFVDPEDMSWGRFNQARDVMTALLPSGGELIRISFGKAVEQGIIGSEVIAYFMYLTQQFMISLGIDEKRCRFKQHGRDELAHYATEAWDFEAELSTGWTELTGIADRGTFDLTSHSRHSGADLTFFKKHEPVTVKRRRIVPNKVELGRHFGAKAKAIAEKMESMESFQGGSLKVTVDGEQYELSERFFSFVEEEVRETGTRITPRVIEPSSGLDRIFYAVLEHSFDESTETFDFPQSIAPIKIGVFPLIEEERLIEIAKSLHMELLSSDIESYYDEHGSIGRRYARMDEIGTPFCVTVDEQTLEDSTVTVRERKTKKQIRVKSEMLVQAIRKLLSGSGLEEVAYNGEVFR